MTAPQPNDRPAAARDGFALAGALLALVIVGAIVTGTFYAGSEEGAIGASVLRSDEAMYLAEAGLNNTIDGQPRSYFDGLADGAVDDLGTTVVQLPDGATLGSYTVQVRRQGPLYTVISTGTVGRGPVRGSRTLAQVVRLIAGASFPTGSAITSYAGVDVSGNATLSGQDKIPSEWAGEGCVDEGLKDAVHSKDPTPVSAKKANHVIGAAVTDATIADSTFNKFGDFTWDQLKAMADKTYPTGAHITGEGPVVKNGKCDTSVQSNWGEPYDSSNPCFRYWPIIYVGGDLKISANGRGQGILLVDGDLDLTGGADFLGIVIVRGSFFSSGNGGHIIGHLMAYNGGSIDSDNTATGNSLVQYSSCAIARAVNESNLAVRHPVPILARSWMDLTASGASF